MISYIKRGYIFFINKGCDQDFETKTIVLLCFQFSQYIADRIVEFFVMRNVFVLALPSSLVWQYRLELLKMCYHPGWRLMRLGYRTCFHTLYDENFYAVSSRGWLFLHAYVKNAIKIHFPLQKNLGNNNNRQVLHNELVTFKVFSIMIWEAWNCFQYILFLNVYPSEQLNNLIFV